MQVKVFDYIKELDCFILNKEFKSITDRLGLESWHATAWIGRLFTLDNDYGEHWFDNWPERDKIISKAQEKGLKEEELLIINPTRFQNGNDGPCHTDNERKQFWTNVLTSLKLDIDLIIQEAIMFNEQSDPMDEDYISDLADRIKTIKNTSH